MTDPKQGLTKKQQEDLMSLAEEVGGKKPNMCFLYETKDGNLAFEFTGDLPVLYGLACGASKLIGDKFSEIVNRPRGTQAGLVQKEAFKPVIEN